MFPNFDWLNDIERYRLLLWLVGVCGTWELSDGTLAQPVIDALGVTCDLPAGLPIAHVRDEAYRTPRQYVIFGFDTDGDETIVRIASLKSYQIDSVSPSELVLTGQNTDGRGGFG